MKPGSGTDSVCMCMCDYAYIYACTYINMYARVGICRYIGMWYNTCTYDDPLAATFPTLGDPWKLYF